MRRILDRYIFREVTQTWFAVTAVLLFILLTNQFARVLGDVAKDKLPKDAVFQIIGYTALQYLTILVPIGLFLSIMLALGRMYADSEMPAMMACRVGPAGIYRPIIWLTVPLVIGVAWLAVDIGPKAVKKIQHIAVEARRQADLASIEPGKFVSGHNAGTVVYAEEVVGPGQVENVFLQSVDRNGNVEVVVAERGEQRDSEDTNVRYFVLYNGRRYSGVPGSPRFSVMEFAEHGIPYRLPDVSAEKLETRAMQTADLFRSNDLDEVAELHWRIGIPISTLILAILAVPLSRSQPRHGRYGRIAVGLLVFIIYFNLLSVGKAWLEQGAVPTGVGIWWVHVLMLVFALGMIGVHNGVHRRLRR